MIRTVQCSSCSTSFPVDPRKVPEEGVYARCSACDAVFFVDAGEPPTDSQDEATLADEATTDLSRPSEAEPAESVSAEPTELGESEPASPEVSAEGSEADAGARGPDAELDSPPGEVSEIEAESAPTE